MNYLLTFIMSNVFQSRVPWNLAGLVTGHLQPPPHTAPPPVVSTPTDHVLPHPHYPSPYHTAHPATPTATHPHYHHLLPPAPQHSDSSSSWMHMHNLTTTQGGVAVGSGHQQPPSQQPQQDVNGGAINGGAGNEYTKLDNNDPAVAPNAGGQQAPPGPGPATGQGPIANSNSPTVLHPSGMYYPHQVCA